MALTARHVALTLRPEPDHGPEPGWTPMQDDELWSIAHRLDAEAGEAPLWLFAYGSLIWKPDFEAIEQRRASAFGWHRSFCLQIRSWRGSPAQPGLMMALERGGRCDGVAYRLRPHDRLAQIHRMLAREIRFHENREMVRWIPLHGDGAPRRALVFWAGPRGPRILSRLPLPEVARTLARACGHAGSCAEYLFNTVRHLEMFGIRDRNLWRLQQLVAEEIEALHAPPLDPTGPARR